jgi:hypothetical protein
MEQQEWGSLSSCHAMDQQVLAENSTFDCSFMTREFCESHSVEETRYKVISFGKENSK